VKFRQPSHEFTFGVGMNFISYPLVLTPLVIDVQTGSARWAGTNTARERYGSACLVLVPGTTHSNGRHGPRHDGRWIPATPPCDR
jgi:hypothetical protein